jgi:hypothetical protein
MLRPGGWPCRCQEVSGIAGVRVIHLPSPPLSHLTALLPLWCPTLGRVPLRGLEFPFTFDLTVDNLLFPQTKSTWEKDFRWVPPSLPFLMSYSACRVQLALFEHPARSVPDGAHLSYGVSGLRMTWVSQRCLTLMASSRRLTRTTLSDLVSPSL